MILELVYAVSIGSLATILLLAINRHERNYRIGILLRLMVLICASAAIVHNMLLLFGIGQ
jgi:hypothetical protein